VFANGGWQDAKSPMGPHAYHALVAGPDGSLFLWDRSGSERFDGSMWTFAMDPPNSRDTAAAFVEPGGDAFLVGGNVANQAVADVDRFALATLTWKMPPPPPMVIPRRSLAAASARDGRIYAIGGADSSGNEYRSVEVLQQNQWSAGPDLPDPTERASAVTVADGRILLIGGDVNGHPSTQVLALCP
jgi:hypothetical protein